MFSIRRRLQDPSTLIWEYLDGGITPSRAKTLSRLLERRGDVREKLVDSAVLHSMLRSYYAKQAQSSDIDFRDEAQDSAPARKKRNGKPSAA